MSHIPARSSREQLGAVDPIALVELLDTHYDDDGGPEGSSYRRLYRESKQAFLQEDGQAAVNFSELLTAVDASVGVEEAIHRAGFVVGFECCRRLLLGELDLTALKDGGAR